MARPLAVKPEVLLCDEPTSALDLISAAHIEEQLLTLRKDYTIAFVTHILRQASRLTHYVIFLYLGESIEHGSADVRTEAVKPLQNLEEHGPTAQTKIEELLHLPDYTVSRLANKPEDYRHIRREKKTHREYHSPRNPLANQ